MKRSINGTYVSVNPHHRQAYLGEQVFCFNERRGNDRDSFQSALGAVGGKRLTWRN